MCIVVVASYPIHLSFSPSLSRISDRRNGFFLVDMSYGLEGNCSELCTYVYGSTHSIFFPSFFLYFCHIYAPSRRLLVLVVAVVACDILTVFTIIIFSFLCTIIINSRLSAQACTNCLVPFQYIVASLDGNSA